jgi:hypothetical protein
MGENEMAVLIVTVRWTEEAETRTTATLLTEQRFPNRYYSYYVTAERISRVVANPALSAEAIPAGFSFDTQTLYIGKTVEYGYRTERVMSDVWDNVGYVTNQEADGSFKERGTMLLASLPRITLSHVSKPTLSGRWTLPRKFRKPIPHGRLSKRGRTALLRTAFLSVPY